ncbi:MAG: phasin family protein [Erythrobacter sp.]|nr:phasin family protein [Erythrobacter sp.]
MADTKPKIEVSAVKEEAPVATVAAPAPVAAPTPKAAAKPVPAKPAAVKKPAASKPASRKAAPKAALAKKAAPAKKPVARKAVAAPKPVKAPALTAPKTTTKTPSSVTQLKEKIMATKTPDFTAAFTDTVNGAVAEMQTKAQAAYDKGTEAVTEMTAFAKGNVEAIVESGKLFAEGVQGMGKTMADDAKSAYETATADLKEMAAVKSPTDLFALQGKILRRNFDAMVAATSKSTDATLKLANDVFAPISGRVNLAAEKLSKVA